MAEKITTAANPLKEYLADPFLDRLYCEIRRAGPLKSVSVDITQVCNLRCIGCYFFAEKMNRHEPENEAALDGFIEREKARGTNFVTVVGGEPSLVLHRLKKIYENFCMNVATNGLCRIPYQGFENMPIGISVWGDRQTDQKLRGGDKVSVFPKALDHYKGDPRAFWYYTVVPGKADEIESVVEQCVANGNYVLFNFYGDVGGFGGCLDHRQGFAAARKEIRRMIARYPQRILITSYLSKVVSTGRLYDETWGYDVCTSISSDNEANQERIKNGKPYNPHFRAYNADFATTRRCCTGKDRDCSSCFDVWEHFSWIMLNMRRHLGSKQEFTNWLTTMYLFYLINRIIDFENGVRLLPEIHRRTGGLHQDEELEEHPVGFRPAVAAQGSTP
ncbi:MAG: 4Fe-4S cluster-binding domain-containing protein [Acidobacteria bacterium]|nr:4Fe-4S cluster-binding domain-containing protein [Acidobacteriota bacterium]